jgi:hypothetical protein
MIIDYCRENKVAITFESIDQYNKITSIFSYDDTIPWHKGVLSFYIAVSPSGLKTTYTCSDPDCKYWLEDYVVISAEDFFELVDENISILETIKS